MVSQDGNSRTFHSDLKDKVIRKGGEIGSPVSVIDKMKTFWCLSNLSDH